MGRQLVTPFVGAGRGQQFVVGSGMVWAMDLTLLTPGAVSSMPYGLVHARNSVGRCQTSASEVSTQISADVARAAYTARGNGLLIEGASTNLVPDARDLGGASWGAEDAGVTTTLNAAAGPDGAVLADQTNAATNKVGRYAQLGVLAAGTYAASFWARLVSGSGNWQWATNNDELDYQTDAATTTWKRFAKTMTNTGVNGYVQPVDLRPAASAVNGYHDFHQVELGSFSTSPIVTSGGTGTRAADRLYHATPSSLLSSGRLGLHASFVPHGARSAYSAAVRVWTIDANNYCSLSQSDGKVTVVIDGSSFTTANGATWSAGDLVDLWVESGGASLQTVVKYRVNSGATAALGISGSAQAAISPGANPVDFLCNGTASQLTSVLLGLYGYNSSHRPAWAA